MIKDHFDEYFLAKKTAEDAISYLELEKFIEVFKGLQLNRRILWVAGNGGSASTASHMCTDFSKGLDENSRTNIKALCLNDSIPTTTAWANDVDYSSALGSYLRSVASPGDVVLAITGSGNSENILDLLQCSKELGLISLSMTGFSGGKAARISDLNINVPSNNMQIIEDIHLSLCHWFMRFLKGDRDV